MRFLKSCQKFRLNSMKIKVVDFIRQQVLEIILRDAIVIGIKCHPHDSINKQKIYNNCNISFKLGLKLIYFIHSLLLLDSFYSFIIVLFSVFKIILIIMTEEYSQCKQTIYDLTQLRGHNDENSKLWQLVNLLTKQNELYQNTINEMQKHLKQYRSNLQQLGTTLKIQSSKVQSDSINYQQLQSTFKRITSSINTLIEESKKQKKEVQVPVFVQKEVIVERRIEIPVEVQRIVQVERIIEVERFIEVEKPVFVQRIVERIVEKEKRVQVPVYIEKIVEVPVEVPIYIEKKVEVVKPIYIDRLVQVERPIIVERIIQVECPVCSKK